MSSLIESERCQKRKKLIADTADYENNFDRSMQNPQIKQQISTKTDRRRSRLRNVGGFCVGYEIYIFIRNTVY